jgi:hypothetical protein
VPADSSQLGYFTVAVDVLLGASAFEPRSHFAQNRALLVNLEKCRARQISAPKPANSLFLPSLTVVFLCRPARIAAQRLTTPHACFQIHCVP